MAALDFDSFLARKHFPDLDGLRAIAVLAVVWHHTRPQGLTGKLASGGYHGVSLFFAISGFLITSLLVREQLRNGKIDLKAFYIRRSLRIFPLYFGTLLIYTILVIFFERNTTAGVEFLKNLNYFATYTSNLFVPLGGERVIFYFSWSLATEEQFYLLWPPLMVALGTASGAMLAMSLTLVAALIALESGIDFAQAIPFAILGGSLASLLLHHRRIFQRLEFLLGHRLTPAVALFAAALSIAIPGTPDYSVHFFAVALVASCAIQDYHHLTPLFNFKALVSIGTVSYGIYMLHMLSKNVCAKALSKLGDVWVDALIFPSTAIVAFFVARASFKHFESRFLNIKKNFER